MSRECVDCPTVDQTTWLVHCTFQIDKTKRFLEFPSGSILAEDPLFTNSAIASQFKNVWLLNNSDSAQTHEHFENATDGRTEQLYHTMEYDATYFNAMRWDAMRAAAGPRARYHVTI